MFSFSNFLLQVNIEIQSEEIDNRNIVVSSLLTLEVLFGTEQRRKITFDSRNKKIVRVGRLKNDETDFTFADEDVSRKQCILTYEDNNCYAGERYYDMEEGAVCWGCLILYARRCCAGRMRIAGSAPEEAG